MQERARENPEGISESRFSENACVEDRPLQPLLQANAIPSSGGLSAPNHETVGVPIHADWIARAAPEVRRSARVERSRQGQLGQRPSGRIGPATRFLRWVAQAN